MKDKLTKHFKKASFIIDSLFPAICISCRKIVGRYGSFCSDCWQNIHFITNPFCYKCGVPFGYDIGDNALCGR
ncbi:MAG: double zinc ribbon domain-containing protein, partial [Pseudomonadota bacterium]